MRKTGALITAAAIGLAITLPVAAAEEAITVLPEKDLFRPLLADPKEPRFQIGLLWVDSEVHDTRVGAVGFGENFGIARWAGRHPGEAWQLNLSAAVLAQFGALTSVSATPAPLAAAQAARA